ncbi:hypothetical protein [Paenibacillus sp. J22TS3]|uniref:hypothetical protein n=1 Tax=Paenibacillus sp. J22TS3 TaxID=2807192 RepID=UPI001B006027|nr:hypothetical protein [Paenibacillus sp. J22TS3]GIP21293.1 hypothetical protein J22TS3_15680 [Paenibacillus sp. J22TS3]
MKNRLCRLLRTSLLLSLVLSSHETLFAAPAYANAAAELANIATAPEKVEQFAQKMIKNLSSQDPFRDWAGARLYTQPLGPGTHSWMVIVEGTSPASSGYLIIGAAPHGGYALIEYGLGSDPLFSEKSREQMLSSLRSQGQSGSFEVEMRYAGPALAEWKAVPKAAGLPSKYFDAVSGELLPESDASWARQLNNPLSLTSPKLVNSSHKLKQPDKTVITSRAFNTYENLTWMVQKPLQLKTGAITAVLKQKKRLVYASRGGDRTYSISLPVNGFQRWAGDDTIRDCTYILSKSGSLSRWIALPVLEQMGEFYETDGS